MFMLTMSIATMLGASLATLFVPEGWLVWVQRVFFSALCLFFAWIALVVTIIALSTY